MPTTHHAMQVAGIDDLRSLNDHPARGGLCGYRFCKA
jgi:hypothetical protein